MCCVSVRPAILALLALALLCATRAEGQFTTVINVPGDVPPSTIGLGTQLNLLDGGIIGSLNVSGGEANIFGGQVSRIVNQSGAVNISGGTVYTGGVSVGGTGSLRIDGGHILSYVSLHGQSEMIVTGGQLGPYHIRPGEGGSGLYLRDTSVATFSGGTVPDEIELGPQATLVLHGDNFRINGELLVPDSTPGQTVFLKPNVGDLVTGILADGTAFHFFPNQYEPPYSPPSPLGTLKFVTSTLAEFAPEVHVVGAQAPSSVRAGQTLFLGDGGTLPAGFFADWDSHLVIVGEDAAGRVHARGADVTVSAGKYVTVEADYGTQVTIAGGSTSYLSLRSSSHARIEAGSVGEIRVDDSELIIEGGRVTGALGSALASRNASLKLRGGVIEKPMFIGWGTDLEIAGGIFAIPGLFYPTRTLFKGRDFAIDGVPIPETTDMGDTMEMPQWTNRSVLTGTLSDGTPLIMSLRELPPLPPYNTFTFEVTDVPEAPAAHFEVPREPAPPILREGQSLAVGVGGIVDNLFRARGATVLLEGGTIGEEFKASDTQVHIAAGTVGRRFIVANSQITLTAGSIGPIAYFLERTRLDMSGGTIGNNPLLDWQSHAKVTAGTIGSNFQVRDSTLELEGGVIGPSMSVGGPYSVVNVKGGSIGDRLNVAGNATINVYGGEIGNAMTIGSRGIAHIHGGSFGEEISLLNLSTFTLYGTHFALEGEPLPSLEPGVPYLLNLRNTTLTTTLSDGSPFTLDLLSTSTPGRDFVHSGAKLYLVLVQVPEPATALLFALSCLTLLHRNCRLFPR